MQLDNKIIQSWVGKALLNIIAKTGTLKVWLQKNY